MALAEDAASVLEQFVQDVANLPAEIAHLLEEIQAKDRVVQECRSAVNTRDNSIQKFLKANGCSQANPKEEAYVKNAMANFDKARVIQDEKVSLSEKAATLLDRQIKRLDLKIRDLQNEGAISIDPQLPSLLNNNTHRLPSLSSSATTGASTPLHPLSGNAGPSTTIANNPLTRLVQPSASTQRHASPAKAPQPPVTTNGTASAASSLNPARSSSSDPSKRRRLNTHLAVPPASSSLRQSSLGPGTPKPPTAQAARGSSVGPTRPTTKKPPRTAPPHQRIGHLNPTKKLSGSQARRRLHGAHRKSGLSTNMKASPSISSTGDSASVSELDGGEAEEGGSDAEMGDGEVGEEDADGEGDDTRKYCTCRSVSYGNMVACDNDDCPYEWFHWSCVGMTKEPAGKWYCPECRQRLGIEKQ